VTALDQPAPVAGVDGWEVVIGLEVHAELSTATKLFCGCPNVFGADPNTNVCPVCLGLPGSLPVVNGTAVEFAIRLGQALHCDVVPSIFARKNYFYPDMPKDYQISQYDRPINVDGWLELPSGKRIGIERAHMEEDTGKNTHVGKSGRIHAAEYSLIDYNRAGVPLVEIVSAPDLRSTEEARAYVQELRDILIALDVSDARMEEGSMRVDANVSVRLVGDETLGTRCEIKNLNSLRSLVRAVAYEARRQVELIIAGDRVVQETRHWDEDAGRTRAGRTKEEAEDYRYFAEPDLVPVEPDHEWLEAVRDAQPPLPAHRRASLAAAAGIDATDPAVALAVDRDLDGLALAAIHAGADPGRVLTHVQHNLAVEGADRLDSERFARFVGMEAEGRLTATQAKVVLAELVAGGGDPEAIAAAHGFEAMTAGDLEAVVDEAIAADPGAWAKFVAGDGKAMGALIGYVMAKTDRKADGKAVNALLRQKRDAAAG
jgi:aspartyl-tRNA(Asn)/glutamyl-tRNA(Gln) amidotransferase subunit B